jgi:hypothetical protein
MGDTNDINKIFQIVDSDGSGFLDKEKLQHICPNLSPSEIDIIFNDLDTDHDNRISLNEFTHGFKELIQSNDNHRTAYKNKLTKSENTTDKEEEDLSTNMTQMQINEVFNNLSWYENKPFFDRYTITFFSNNDFPLYN